MFVRSCVLRSEHMRAEQSSLLLPLRQSRSPHHSMDPKKEIKSSKPMCCRKYLENLRIKTPQFTKCACQIKTGCTADVLMAGANRVRRRGKASSTIQRCIPSPNFIEPEIVTGNCPLKIPLPYMASAMASCKAFALSYAHTYVERAGNDRPM